MKAMHIMLFLFIFNLALSIVSATNIYNLTGYETESTEDFEALSEYEAMIASQEAARGQSARALMQTMITYFGVLAIAAIVGAVSGLSEHFSGIGFSFTDSFVYTFFTGMFITVSFTAANVFIRIGEGEGYGVLIIVITFLLICGVIYTIGIIQVISKGGWKAFM